MNINFNSCTKAIEHTNKTKKYSLFHSEKSEVDFSIHVHECCEAFLCLGGGKTFLINDRVYEVSDSDLFLINQFETHKIAFKNDTVFSRYVFKVHPAFLYSVSTDKTDLSACFYKRGNGISNKISLTAGELAELKNLLEQLTAENEYADDIVKDIVATKILVFINYLFAKNSKSTGTYYIGNNIVQKTIAYINSNYQNDLSLCTLAKNAYISENQLCRLFKKELGITISKYITSKRISEAKRLLRTDNNVSTTAAKCGYKDYASFIRAFKKVVGISPGKY
ncbi:MAG: helix-turn-helix transcriptional regulator [Clostridiaceae bacterium]|nr:helix-turn-helix transcriptional regulator [Clostridiaceae bacterium]